MERGAWRASDWGRKELDTTEQLSPAHKVYKDNECKFSE